MAGSSHEEKFSTVSLASAFRLRDCAEIIVGLEYEALLKTDRPSPYRELQIKHIAPDQPVNFDSLSPIKLKRAPGAQMVQAGDVLFTARNQRKIALPVLAVPENIVVRSSIFILRVIAQQIAPEYLAWYLNHPTVQSYLAQQAKGSNVAVISRVEAAHIPILLPSLAQQKAIVRVHKLRLKEARILHELEAQKNLLLDTLLFQRLSKSTEETVVHS